MKVVAKALVVIIEVCAALFMIPFLGSLIAVAIAFPIVGLPIVVCAGLYIWICYLINRSIFSHE